MIFGSRFFVVLVVLLSGLPAVAFEEWLMLGPMPTAGLTINNAWGERQCAPANAQIYRAEGWDGWWRQVESQNGALDILVNASNYSPVAWPPHYPDIVYLHSYLSVTSLQNVAFSVAGALSDIHVLLDGEYQKVEDQHFPLRLEPGTHRLLLKCFGFQETGVAWNVSCRLLDEQGAAAEHVSLSLNDPTLSPVELRYRDKPAIRPGEAPSDRIDIHFKNGRRALAMRTFAEHRDLPLTLSLHYMDDFEMLRAYGPAKFSAWSSFRGSCDVQIFDFWGQSVGLVTNTITIARKRPAPIHVDLPALERGHYTMQVSVKDMSGRVLMRRNVYDISRTTDGSVPLQFAVLSAERNNTPEPDSKLATSVDGSLRRLSDPEWMATLDQARTLGSRLHMCGSDVFWPETDSTTGTSSTGKSQVVWNDTIARQIAHAERIGLPLVGNMAGWTASPSNLLALASLTQAHASSPEALDEHVRNLVSLSVSHYRNSIRHWRFHNAMNTSAYGSTFRNSYARTFSNAVAAIHASMPDATIIAPGLMGADTNSLMRFGIPDRIGSNDWINLHTYSWGNISEPALVSDPVRKLLEGSGYANPIVISRSGHDRAFPGNGVLGQTQQLAKWFGFALTQARIPKVFFGMQAGERWTPVDAQSGPYPAWVALRTLGLLLDGADYLGPIKDGPTTFAFRFRKGDTHLILLWHDAPRPAQIRSARDGTFVNMMDQRFPVKAGSRIPVDRLPVIVFASERIDISAWDEPDE